MSWDIEFFLLLLLPTQPISLTMTSSIPNQMKAAVITDFKKPMKCDTIDTPSDLQDYEILVQWVQTAKCFFFFFIASLLTTQATLFVLPLLLEQNQSSWNGEFIHFLTTSPSTSSSYYHSHYLTSTFITRHFTSLFQCHTDLQVIEGVYESQGAHSGMVGSHEPAGIVVKLGKKAEEDGKVKLGDRVGSINTFGYCGECNSCKHQGQQLW